MLKSNNFNPRKNDNVISLRDKLETWHPGFVDSQNQIEVKISNHGRASICTGVGQTICLSFVDAVNMLQSLNSKLEEVMGKSSTKR